MPKGGIRPGSGRPPGRRRSAHHQAAQDIAQYVLCRIDAAKIWMKLLRCNSPKIVFATMQYLTDRAYGRPVQMIAGDPNTPVTIQLSWNGSPQWQSAPVLSDPLAIPELIPPNILIPEDLIPTDIG